MSSYGNLLVTVLLLLLLPAYSHGQEYRAGQYKDLGLYYSLLEAEKRDSAYHKALAQWQDSLPKQDGLVSTAFTIKDRKLAADYRSAILLPEQTEKDVKAKTDALMLLSKQAAKKNEAELEADALARAFILTFWHKPQNYDKAFYIAFRLEELLPQVSESQYPDKRKMYYKLGEAYYLFLDFHKSLELLENALAPVPLALDDRANLDALSIMGICYANIGRMDTSDKYFRAMLLSDNVILDRPLYNAYALSHLGCNAMLTGHYDKAIALSKEVWPILRKETTDYGHLAGMCYCRGRSYLEKGDFRQAGAWIDSLVYFAGKDGYNPTKRIKQSHLLRADYYTALGDARQARTYSDSLVNIYKREEANFTSQYITRASEKYNREKISIQSERLRVSRNNILLLLLAVALSLAAAAVIYSLYRRKNAAYKMLAQKAGEWAASREIPQTLHIPDDEPDGDTAAQTAEDNEIMERVQAQMIEHLAYRAPGLTIEKLAECLGIHRNTLSGAINRATGGNFKQYVNNFRIKEAVRIISGTSHKDLYIDEIYERVGFSNRTSFYRVFKQMTGLSPRELQENSKF